MDALLKYTTLFSLFLGPLLSRKALLVLVQVSALLRSYGRPSLSADYRDKLKSSEFSLNVVYILATLQQDSWVFYFPLMIQLFMGTVSLYPPRPSLPLELLPPIPPVPALSQSIGSTSQHHRHQAPSRVPPLHLPPPLPSPPPPTPAPHYPPLLPVPLPQTQLGAPLPEQPLTDGPLRPETDPAEREGLPALPESHQLRLLQAGLLDP